MEYQSSVQYGYVYCVIKNYHVIFVRGYVLGENSFLLPFYLSKCLHIQHGVSKLLVAVGEDVILVDHCSH